MPMSPTAATEACRTMLDWRAEESARLDKIHNYFLGTQRHPFPPEGTPQDVRRLAEMSRVNMMKIVVNSLTQNLYVDGYRRRLASEDDAVWLSAWQPNRFDARQIAVHRSALEYGVSYVAVTPGDTAPVLKGYSPRAMTTQYGDTDDWPIMALSALASGGDHWNYRLYDEEAIYFFEGRAPSEGDKGGLTYLDTKPHGMDVCPVVRFLNEQDLDEDNQGEIEPLYDLQDQIDLTTFSLLVAQHFAAFRQRYIIGWTASSEQEAMKAAASRIMTFSDSPTDITVGEFEQTLLDGYLQSREATLKQIATLSQVPVHELVGSLVNLSAEALVAAEAGERRKIVERQTSFGESWEQVFELSGVLADEETDEEAQVRWRDTESRALAATVDALGKMASMLGIPKDELWERIPNVSSADIARWREKYDPTLDNPVASMERFLAQRNGPPAEGAGSESAAATSAA